MKHPLSTGFAIVRAEQSDIPSLIRVHIAAFASNNAVRVMFKDSAAYEKKWQEILRAHISDPNVGIIKAVSKDGEIFGWLCCAWIGLGDSEVQEMFGKLGGTEKQERNGGTALRHVIEKESARARNEWMAGKRYIYVAEVACDPPHQGQGVGTALVNWVTTRADRDGIPCWLESTPVAHRLYYRAGFRLVGRIEVDLGEFVPGAKQEKLGWGPYEDRYMLRLPEDTKETWTNVDRD